MPRIEPAFIDLPALSAAPDAPPRRRFAVLHVPDRAPQGLVLYVHPLAEEMNKSRRMAALQARALAAAGHLVLQPDLLGCGDSPGDFGDASWAAWVDDLVAAAGWLRQRCAQDHPGAAPPPLTLWGLRAGALLAAAAAARLGDVARLLLWQPAPAGKPLLQQFLRLAVAAEVVGGGAQDAAAGPATDAPPGAAPRGGTEALRQRLRAGETVEIAGYPLAPALAAGLDAARLDPPAGVTALAWLECGPREEPALLPASQPVLQAWRGAGCAVHATAVRGPAFWQTTEIEDAPALIEATLAALAAPALAPRPELVPSSA